MLYGNESISQYTRSNVTIWMAMAFQAGILNIGGFLGCHRFVSHVTGFATFFAVDLTTPSNHNALGMLAVPLFFLLGSMLSGVLVDLRLKLHKKPKYFISFGIMFVILLFVLLAGYAGYFGNFGEPLDFARDYTLLISLCLVCGIQNGTITSVSKSVVRTTHLTGITTDLGVGLVRILNRKKLGAEVAGEGSANLMRVGIIFFFGAGSVVGGILFSHFGFGGFLVPVATSGTLFSVMLYMQFKRRHVINSSVPPVVG